MNLMRCLRTSRSTQYLRELRLRKDLQSKHYHQKDLRFWQQGLRMETALHWLPKETSVDPFPRWHQKQEHPFGPACRKPASRMHYLNYVQALQA